MTHKDLFTLFKYYFPQYVDQIMAWFPNGKDSIRIRTGMGLDYIFTYYNNRCWRFETVNSFYKDHAKGEGSMPM